MKSYSDEPLVERVPLRQFYEELREYTYLLPPDHDFRKKVFGEIYIHPE